MKEDERQNLPFPCPICQKRFGTRLCLKKHGKVHEGDEARVHQCPKCDMKFKRKGNLDMHFYGVHSEENLQASLQRKMSGNESVKPDRHKCPDCEKTYTTRSSMYEHHRSKHGGVGLQVYRNKDPRTSDGKFLCPECGKTFIDKRSLKCHQGKKHRSTNIEINRFDGGEPQQNSEHSMGTFAARTQSSRHETPQQATNVTLSLPYQYHLPSSRHKQNTGVVQTQTYERRDESFHRMGAIQGSSNSSSIIRTNVTSDTFGGQNALHSSTVHKQQTGAQQPSAGPCFRNVSNSNSFLFFQRDFRYPTQEASYPPPLSWHHNQALETGCVAIPNYAPLGPRELSLQLLQILQPPFQVHPHNTERYFSPSVRGRHASQITYQPQNIQPTLVTRSGNAGTNNGGDGIINRISLSSSPADLLSVPWEVVLKALQDYGKNSSTNGSK